MRREQILLFPFPSTCSTITLSNPIASMTSRKTGFLIIFHIPRYNIDSSYTISIYIYYILYWALDIRCCFWIKNVFRTQVIIIIIVDGF